MLRRYLWLTLWLHFAWTPHNVYARDEREYVHIKLHMPDVMKKHIHHQKVTKYHHHSAPRHHAKKAPAPHYHHRHQHYPQHPNALELYTDDHLLGYSSPGGLPAQVPEPSAGPNYGPALFDPPATAASVALMPAAPPTPTFMPDIMSSVALGGGNTDILLNDDFLNALQREYLGNSQHIIRPERLTQTPTAKPTKQKHKKAIQPLKLQQQQMKIQQQQQQQMLQSNKYSNYYQQRPNFNNYNGHNNNYNSYAGDLIDAAEEDEEEQSSDEEDGDVPESDLAIRIKTYPPLDYSGEADDGDGYADHDHNDDNDHDDDRSSGISAGYDVSSLSTTNPVSYQDMFGVFAAPTLPTRLQWRGLSSTRLHLPSTTTTTFGDAPSAAALTLANAYEPHVRPYRRDRTRQRERDRKRERERERARETERERESEKQSKQRYKKRKNRIKRNRNRYST